MTLIKLNVFAFFLFSGLLLTAFYFFSTKPENQKRVQLPLPLTTPNSPSQNKEENSPIYREATPFSNENIPEIKETLKETPSDKSTLIPLKEQSKKEFEEKKSDSPPNQKQRPEKFESIDEFIEFMEIHIPSKKLREEARYSFPASSFSLNFIKSLTKVQREQLLALLEEQIEFGKAVVADKSLHGKNLIQEDIRVRLPKYINILTPEQQEELVLLFEERIVGELYKMPIPVRHNWGYFFDDESREE